MICIITAAAEITEFLLVKLRRHLSWSASSKTRTFNTLWAAASCIYYLYFVNTFTTSLHLLSEIVLMCFEAEVFGHACNVIKCCSL